MFAYQTTLNLDATWLIYCYVPDETCTGWLEPYVCEDSAADKQSAHQVAKTLRRHFPGHLFGVLHASRTPRLTR